MTPINHTRKETVWSIPFIMIFAVTTFNSIGFHILTPILPMYAVELQLGNSVAGMLGTMFAITSVASRIALTQVNLTGRYRKAIVLALALIAVSMLGFSISNTAASLYLFRLIQGVGWGVCTAALATLAALTLPPSKIGAGIGMFGLGSVFGQALAPNLGLNHPIKEDTIFPLGRESIGINPGTVIGCCIAFSGTGILFLLTEKSV